jgi:hypothetical protein
MKNGTPTLDFLKTTSTPPPKKKKKKIWPKPQGPKSLDFQLLVHLCYLLILTKLGP